MFPPMIASPTSPQDVQMTDLNILSATQEMLPSQKSLTIEHEQHHSTMQAVSIKSSNTLRNNIDVKNELNKKRTSLNLQENGNDEMLNGNDSITSTSSSSSASCHQHQQQQPLKLATVKRCSRNLDNVSYRIDQRNNNINNNFVHLDRSTSSSQSSSTSVDSDDIGEMKQQIDTIAVTVNDYNHSRKVRRMRRKNALQHNNKSSNNDSDEDADYNDRQNGNASDVSNTQKRDSVTSKDSAGNVDGNENASDDDGNNDNYFLCEKFKNTLNAKLCDAVVNSAVVIDGDCVASRRLSLELLSPHEGPLGRRYAEIAPSKNNNNNNNCNGNSNNNSGNATNNKW